MDASKRRKPRREQNTYLGSLYKQPEGQRKTEERTPEQLARGRRRRRIEELEERRQLRRELDGL